MYHYLLVTHLPSFYKVNLYNRLALRLKIFVVFVASSSSIRTADFVGKKFDFDHVILHHGDFETRPKLLNTLRLLALLTRLEYQKAVVGGWDLCEFWATVLSRPRSYNALALESTITESRTAGPKAILKRLFSSRITSAFPCGKMHRELLEALGFNGTSHLTGGVGLFDRGERPQHRKPFSASFLYVGRLSPEKNLELLLLAFSAVPEFSLTLVGSGPMEAHLRSLAPANVKFLPHVANGDIATVYETHDVLVLASHSETWGLVVEEALHYGLPVLVSRHVGCHTELVQEGETGFTFDPDDCDAVVKLLRKVADPSLYARLQQNVAAIDFERRDALQLAAYLDALPAIRRINGLEGA